MVHLSVHLFYSCFVSVCMGGKPKMKLEIIIIMMMIYTVRSEAQDLDIFATTRTTYLEKYRGYVDVIIAHFLIPDNVHFASFKIRGEETQSSIFGCDPRDVSLYMKYGSYPVINPDKSEFPPSFKYVSRPPLYNLEFKSDKKEHYIDVNSPEPGYYFIAAFLKYTDPKYDSITPSGMTPECFAQLDIYLYANRSLEVTEITNGTDFDTTFNSSETFYYKYYVPERIERVVININQIKLNESVKTLQIRVQRKFIPSKDYFDEYLEIGGNSSGVVESLGYNAFEGCWHFIQIQSVAVDGATTNSVNSNYINFRINYFYSPQNQANNNNDSIDLSTKNFYHSTDISQAVPYQEIELIRESGTDSFSFSFNLRKEALASSAYPINLTQAGFTALKFDLMENTDIGGSLQLMAAFKPIVKNSQIVRESKSRKVIICIRGETPDVPVWPNLCRSPNGTLYNSSLVLDSTDKVDLQIPFPEGQRWFVSLKLFCDQCEPCSCPPKCNEMYRNCTRECEASCTQMEVCLNCSRSCKEEVVGSKSGCEKCDCDGACLNTGNSTKCNSSVLLDISSFPCVAGGCGSNGRCMFMVADGAVYTTCVCSNNYRGWACTDDSQADPYWLVVLALLLLTLSNLAFLPVVYVAHKRHYYVEALVYLSICFFSTFYHACDAGNNIISFCITRLGSLQFADFFCALLSIWVTLIAIADLPSLWPQCCHMIGGIILSFITTINKTSVWVFAVPAISGLLIIGLSWYLKYRQVKQNFLRKQYLYINIPLGGAIVGTGLIIFALLQTTDNYKYLHSFWHILMAVSVIILLPKPDTFKPENIL